MRLSANPTTDTVLKLATVSVAMFAFVFVVMVPLYNVLCDALGINGKTSAQAYTAVDAAVDTERSITVQFIATNNDGMPWEFRPQVTAMAVHPGAANDTVFLRLTQRLSIWLLRPSQVFRLLAQQNTSTRRNVFVSTSSRSREKVIR